VFYSAVFNEPITGSLCTSVFDPRTFVVGASGGCYALIGAQFATVIMVSVYSGYPLLSVIFLSY